MTTGDMTSEVSAQRGLYVRKATGLVREVSPASAMWFNVLTAVPGLGLGVSVFYILGTYPGGHIETAYLMIGVLAIAIALPFALLTMIMPRSGADYILVSRSLHPVLGLISSLTLFVALLIAEAFFASTFVSVGVAPALDTIGLISHSSGWVQLATDISTKGWTFGLGITVAAIALAIQALRLRVAMKIMIGLFAAGMFGMVLAAIAMLFTSEASFASHFNALAGSGAYTNLIATATQTGRRRAGDLVGPHGPGARGAERVLRLLLVVCELLRRDPARPELADAGDHDRQRRGDGRHLPGVHGHPVPHDRG